MRQWKTTGTADAARNGIGSLAEGKVVTVGEPLTILQDLDVTWTLRRRNVTFRKGDLNEAAGAADASRARKWRECRDRDIVGP